MWKYGEKWPAFTGADEHKDKLKRHDEMSAKSPVFQAYELKVCSKKDQEFQVDILLNNVNFHINSLTDPLSFALFCHTQSIV